MTSERQRAAGGRNAYVWVWLPGSSAPVVGGVVVPTGGRLQNEQVLAFRYAASYLGRPEAISLWTPELPLRDEVFDPRRPAPGRDPLPFASCLRDAAPDAWGRRVINLRLGNDASRETDELTYVLGSGSNRIGALDFQASPDHYVARDDDATLDQLMDLAALVEAGEHIPDSLAAAAQHGTSIGGARPKALLRDGGRQLIAKFASSGDDRPVVKSEALAMLLADRAGIDVAPVEVRRVNGKDVLLVERFDRVRRTDGTIERRGMLSMLTILGLSAAGSWGASYADIAQEIRTGVWADVPGALREMFTRLVFNILIGNNDDHLRNHAAFWDGRTLALTPAYDLAPQIRNTDPSSQAIAITRDGQRASQLRLAVQVAPEFHLRHDEATGLIDSVRSAIETHWDECADLAQLTGPERAALRGRQFLNPYVDYDQA
jgi:serine/threonine-protein kinase HipA